MTERKRFEAWAASEWKDRSIPHNAWLGWQARATLDKSSFAHFVEEQEGNGPDAPSVGGKDDADARRYRAFFDAGLPITFLGKEYRSKAHLDAAIDSLSQEGAEG